MAQDTSRSDLCAPTLPLVASAAVCMMSGFGILWRCRRRAGGRAAVLGVLLALLVSAPARAHEGEADIRAADAVRQAIAYLVNDPGDMDLVADKVADALEAEDRSSVDVALVTQARTALRRNDLPAVRALLERSIGAVPDLSGTDVQPILRVPEGEPGVRLATGEQTGTDVVVDPLPGRGGLTGTDWTILGLAAVLAVAGATLAARWRPPDSVRALRRRATGR